MSGHLAMMPLALQQENEMGKTQEKFRRMLNAVPVKSVSQIIFKVKIINFLKRLGVLS